MSSTAVSALQSANPLARAARIAAIFAAFLVFIEVGFHPPVNLYVFGIANGALYGLIAVGIILIYRTNRIINFAAAGLGAIPATIGTLLLVKKGVPYPAAMLITVVLGVGLGALVDIAVIRRFAQSPRLIVTVATLGVVQVMALIAVYIPGMLGADQGISSTLPTPWKGFRVLDARGAPILTGDYVFAVLMVIALTGGLAAFFRFTRMGIALRASAENADRALLLGIPVRRVGTVAWMLAGLFGSITIFLRAPLVGVPTDGSLGFNVLLFTLAAAVVARMEHVYVALIAGMAVGILEQASVVRTGSSDLGSAFMLFLVLGALLLQRGSLSRAYDTGVSTWQAVKEFRPVPRELKDLPEVRRARAILSVGAVVILLGAPFALPEGSIGRLSLLPIYAIVAVSLVILTGWAGQISLGQFGIVGAGAAAAGGLAANHNIDFFAACFVGIAAGVGVALLIGLPALRVQGLYLAVTTLAFGGAMESYFLNRRYWIGSWLLPRTDALRIRRPVLWGRVSLESDRAFYYLGLAFLALTIAAARAFRRNRSGRVLIAARDNQRAAPAYGINLARSRLAAFAVSGGIAGLAGVLLAYDQGAVDADAYGIFNSITIFLITVIGGLTSLSGAVYGVLVIKGSEFFIQPVLQRLINVSHLDLLFTGPGLILGLLTLPGGYAEGLFAVRDKYLRRLADKHGILVPSLVADRRVEDELAAAEDDVIEAAQVHVAEVEHFDAVAPAPHPAPRAPLSRTIVCPTCGEELVLAEAADHPHFRPDRQPAGVRGRSR